MCARACVCVCACDVPGRAASQGSSGHRDLPAPGPEAPSPVQSAPGPASSLASGSATLNVRLPSRDSCSRCASPRVGKSLPVLAGPLCCHPHVLVEPGLIPFHARGSWALLSCPVWSGCNSQPGQVCWSRRWSEARWAAQCPRQCLPFAQGNQGLKTELWVPGATCHLVLQDRLPSPCGPPIGEHFRVAGTGCSLLAVSGQGPKAPSSWADG